MENVDPCLYDLNYKSADNIAYLAAMLELTWGSDRILTIMKAARLILDEQERQAP